MEGLLLRDAQAVCRCNGLGSKLAPFFQMIKVIAAIFRARVPCSMSNRTACPGLTSVLVEKQNLSGLLVSVAGGVEKIVCCDIRNHKGRPRGDVAHPLPRVRVFAPRQEIPNALNHARDILVTRLRVSRRRRRRGLGGELRKHLFEPVNAIEIRKCDTVWTMRTGSENWWR